MVELLRGGEGEERWVGGCVSSREVGRGEERCWEGVLAPERWGEGRRGGVGVRVWHSPRETREGEERWGGRVV